MYTKDFEVEIITPVDQAFEGTMKVLVLPGTEGEMAVLGGHDQVMAMLAPGVTVADDGAERTVFSTGAGFATITGDKVICLVDFAIEVSKLDFDAISEELQDVRNELAGSPSDAGLRVRKEVLEAKMKAQSYGK